MNDGIRVLRTRGSLCDVPDFAGEARHGFYRDGGHEASKNASFLRVGLGRRLYLRSSWDMLSRTFSRGRHSMRRKQWIAFLVFSFAFAIFLLGCQQQPPQPQAPPDTRAADEATLRDLDAQWSKAAGAKDVEGFLSFHAEDAAQFPPNTSMVMGKEAIRKWASELLASPGIVISWQATKAEASRGSDLGYTFGTYEMTLKDAKGKTVSDRGKYVTIWKKQSDGSWKVVADIFNTDLPASKTGAH